MSNLVGPVLEGNTSVEHELWLVIEINQPIATVHNRRAFTEKFYLILVFIVLYEKITQFRDAPVLSLQL